MKEAEELFNRFAAPLVDITIIEGVDYVAGEFIMTPEDAFKSFKSHNPEAIEVEGNKIRATIYGEDYTIEVKDHTPYISKNIDCF